MIKYYILPTCEAFAYFSLAEHYLMFYEDGLRGLIRDHVLVSDPLLCDNDDLESVFTEDPLQQKIIDTYHGSIGYRQDAFMGVADRKLNDALETSRHVRNWVNRMMRSIFNNDLFTVNEQFSHWMGKDLRVRVDIFWD